MHSTKIISLDMDGTLVTSDFVNSVWLEGIPALYARQYGLDIDTATKLVFQAYESIGQEDKDWYKISYWFARFGLKPTWQDLMESRRGKITFFPEVQGVLRRLKDKYTLIVVSNAAQEFIDMELEPVKDCFHRIYSCVSHFHRVKKDTSVFSDICRQLGVQPQEMCHIGDHYDFDYAVPASLGIRAYLVDRSGERNDGFTVRDLEEFEARLAAPRPTTDH